MSETVVESEQPQRRSRAERPEREVHREPQVEVESGGVERVSPDEALAESQRLIRETEAAQRRAADAERRAREAEAAAVQARGNQAQDRETTVAAAIESAKSDGEAAALALRTAREAGDFDAEVAAQRRLNAADFRFNQATAELQWLKNQPKPQPQQQAGRQITPEAKRWLDEHPRYFTDPGYAAAAGAFDQEAVRSGLGEGSQAYVDYIERKMTALFGEGHGHAPDGTGRQQMAEPRQVRGDAAPPSRGANGGGDSGGWRKVTTPLGEVLMQQTPTGGRRYRMSDDVKSNMIEGARLERTYDRDPDKTLANYVDSHVTMAMEDYTDADGRYYKRGDGETYR